MTAAAGGVFRGPDRQGGDACVRDTRIPVWVLANCRRLGMSEDEILRAYPSLRPADLELAWAYVVANGEEIARAIRENQEGNAGLVE